MTVTKSIRASVALAFADCLSTEKASRLERCCKLFSRHSLFVPVDWTGAETSTSSHDFNTKKVNVRQLTGNRKVMVTTERMWRSHVLIVHDACKYHQQNQRERKERSCVPSPDVTSVNFWECTKRKWVKDEEWGAEVRGCELVTRSCSSWNHRSKRQSYDRAALSCRELFRRSGNETWLCFLDHSHSCLLVGNPET